MFKLSTLQIILNNYFWIVIISQIIIWITGKGYVISVFFPLLLFLLAYKCGLGRKSFFDFAFALILFSMLLSWIMNTYPNKNLLIFRCIMAEGAYMSAYFIGKKLCDEDFACIFKKAIIPLCICCILGLYFFFRPPGWYIAQLFNSEMYYGGDLSFELLRLRSIFSSPYVMSYMCCVTSMFLTFKIFKDEDYGVIQYFCLGLFIITMMFCMMRAPLSCVVLSILVALYYFSRYNGSLKNLFIVCIAVLIIGFIAVLILQRLNTDILQFISDKFETATSGRDELISERVNLWNYNYYLFGDGAGRHAYLADDINPMTAIRDSEYVKILVEQGYFGLSLYILLLSLSLIKCIRYFKYMPFEMCIVIFYAITMIGANSLSTGDKHCFLFWLTVGRIASFKKSVYKSTVIQSKISPIIWR